LSIASASSPSVTNLPRAVLFLLGAHITFSLMDATGKALSRDIAVPLVVLARNGFTLLFMAVALLPLMGWALVRVKHLKLQLWRGLALFGFTTFFFTALQ
jgi:drug/metabolite transporter (DMT)-like permease